MLRMGRTISTTVEERVVSGLDPCHLLEVRVPNGSGTGGTRLNTVLVSKRNEGTKQGDDGLLVTFPCEGGVTCRNRTGIVCRHWRQVAYSTRRQPWFQRGLHTTPVDADCRAVSKLFELQSVRLPEPVGGTHPSVKHGSGALHPHSKSSMSTEGGGSQ